jgi:hypothetical protein
MIPSEQHGERIAMSGAKMLQQIGIRQSAQLLE